MYYIFLHYLISFYQNYFPALSGRVLDSDSAIYSKTADIEYWKTLIKTAVL